MIHSVCVSDWLLTINVMGTPALKDFSESASSFQMPCSEGFAAGMDMNVEEYGQEF